MRNADLKPHMDIERVLYDYSKRGPEEEGYPPMSRQGYLIYIYIYWSFLSTMYLG